MVNLPKQIIRSKPVSSAIFFSPNKTRPYVLLANYISLIRKL